MKKFLIILGGIILLFIAAAVALPVIFKDKIVALVKTSANEQVNARIDFNNDIGLSLFSNFPHFTMTLNDLSVVGLEPFEGDTLLALKEFSATLDIMSVIKGDKIKIIGVELMQPRIHAIVLKDGKANWDITKPDADSTQQESEDTATTKFNINLKRFAITDAFISYDDQQGNMGAQIVGLNHTLTGDFSEELFLMQTLTSSEQVSVSYGGIKYLNKVNFSFKADLDADMKNMKFTFKDNQINLNALVFAFQGWVSMQGDAVSMDITYGADKAAFKEFLSLVPAIYAKDFNTIESSGKLGFDGFVKGTYNEKSLPAFAFNLLIENGMFKYPALPVPVKDVQVQLAVTNPDGVLDHTQVMLSKFHFDVSGDPFDAKLLATQVMTDPSIDAAFKGKVNLANISKIVPLEEGMQLKGLFEMNLTAKGHVSTLEQNAENFNAGGQLKISDLYFISKDLPKAFTIAQAELNFTPKVVNLAKFDAQIGKSDMHMSGELTNFYAYALGKGTIKGVLNYRSDLLDANEFLSDEPQPEQPQVTDTAALDAPAIPERIDFTLNCAVGKLNYTNMEITDFKGQVHIVDQKLEFNKVSLNTLGSSMTLNGYYETTQPKTPTANMDFGINNLDIQKAFITFNTVRKLAPIAEKTTGSFSTKFHLTTAMDQHLNPIYDQLFAEGSLDIPKASIKGVTLFNKAAEVLKYDRLKDPALNNVHIQFKVEKGRIYTQPFDMSVASQKLTLSGSTGLDQTIDYTGKMLFPRSALGSANTALTDLLSKANTKAGTQVKLSDNIPVNLIIGGTFTKPDVSTNLGDAAKDEASSVKDQLAAEAERKRKELEAKARAEAERLKNEASTKAKAEADRLKKEAETKARAEADRLKKEAEAKLKAEEEKAKKKAEEEAKKKLKGLLGK